MALLFIWQRPWRAVTRADDVTSADHPALVGLDDGTFFLAYHFISEGGQGVRIERIGCE